jgi:putative ABC transport system ATP-binding protein
MSNDLVIEDLTIEYSTGDYVLRPIDSMTLHVPSGELVLLLGASGCGKTTLLSAVAGLLTPAAGKISFGDTDVTGLRGGELVEFRRHTVGVIFQVFNLVPSLTASENVQVPLRAAKIKADAAQARAEVLLTRVGLADRMTHHPGDLSGGQQQRVAIARALAHDPPLVLADEPTAHLDYIQVEGILKLLRELATPERVVLVATHDERLLPLADRVIELTRRAGHEARPPQQVALRPGENLFEQGSDGDLVYIVEEGTIELVRARPDGTEDILGLRGPGTYFGELAPLFGIQRSASARAATAAVVTGYGMRDFRERMGATPAQILAANQEADRPPP